MAGIYRDRRDAGRVLAQGLRHYARLPNVTVLALPRGGVPVAYEVADALQLPLDVFVVRKLGVPGNEEYAMGAIATGGVQVLNDDVVARLGLTAGDIRRVAEAERRELERRERLYRSGRPPPAVVGHTAILIDDGLATGSTMLAAVQALRQLRPARIVVAVPTAAAETCRRIRAAADEVLCASTPSPFLAVGHWYEDFSQTSDDEVRALLADAARALHADLH
jgi:predicted phosphoribosyltransferase